MHQEAHEHDHPHDHDHGHDHHDHENEHPHHARRGRGTGRLLLTIIAIALIGWFAYSICFFVDQTEYVYVTEFGKPRRLCVEPGLEFKIPYQSVRRLDRRTQMASPPGSQMLTRDRPRPTDDRDTTSMDRHGTSLGGPPLSVDWYVCWRIPNRECAARRVAIERLRKERDSVTFTPSEEQIQAELESSPPTKDQIQAELEALVLQFMKSVGTISATQDRLRERIDSTLKAKVGQMSLSQFVSLDANEIDLENLAATLTQDVRRDAIQQFGIEVVDVRIKRFNHPEGVKPAIFDMIRAERQGVAERYRAEGKSEAAKIRSLADTERAQILSKAQADAERLRGEGDADAMRIAAEAHGQDPQFYQLLKTLDTYRVILNEKTTIVLSSDSPLLQLLTEGMPKLTNPPKSPRQAGPANDEKPSAPPGAASGNGKSESEGNP